MLCSKRVIRVYRLWILIGPWMAVLVVRYIVLLRHFGYAIESEEILFGAVVAAVVKLSGSGVVV